MDSGMNSDSRCKASFCLGVFTTLDWFTYPIPLFLLLATTQEARCVDYDILYLLLRSSDIVSGISRFYRVRDSAGRTELREIAMTKGPSLPDPVTLFRFHFNLLKAWICHPIIAPFRGSSTQQNSEKFYWEGEGKGEERSRNRIVHDKSTEMTEESTRGTKKRWRTSVVKGSV